jgi:beta-carotene 3-hydroxylase
MSVAAVVGLTVATAVAMEPISATIHRSIGHGVAWPIHRSHHDGPVLGPEMNDIIPLVSALVTVALFAVGVFQRRFAWILPVASGATMYGIAYFVVHDIYIHRRLRLLPKHVGWLEPFKQAHLEHHEMGRGNWGIFTSDGLHLTRAAYRM